MILVKTPTGLFTKQTFYIICGKYTVTWISRENSEKEKQERQTGCVPAAIIQS
jgi:hypothetical protein